MKKPKKKAKAKKKVTVKDLSRRSAGNEAVKGGVIAIIAPQSRGSKLTVTPQTKGLEP